MELCQKVRMPVLVAFVLLVQGHTALAQDDAASLRAEIQEHLDEGETARAATLAHLLREGYDDEESSALAKRVLDGAAKSLTRVTIHCEGCSVAVEDVSQPDVFYVEADTSHDLTATFEVGDTERTLEGKPGQHVQLFLEPPRGPELPPGEGGGASTTGSGRGDGSSGGVSPVMFYVAAGLTAGAAAATIWSAVDMNGDVDAYEETLDRAEQNRSIEDLHEAERLLRRGDDKELRTELLIGVTAGLGLVTGLLALAVDWSGGEQNAAHTLPVLALERDGARLLVRGEL